MASNIRSMVPSELSPEFPETRSVIFIELTTLLGIDVRAFAKSSDSLNISSQLRGSRLAELPFELCCIARIARFGVRATIDLRIASSFSA